MVTPAVFKRSLTQREPPNDLSVALQSLWWAGKDEWERAHRLAMQGEGADVAWVHAYLHRVEGDLPNAGYWYRQAKRPVETIDLVEEWTALVTELLSAGKERVDTC